LRPLVSTASTAEKTLFTHDWVPPFFDRLCAEVVVFCRTYVSNEYPLLHKSTLEQCLNIRIDMLGRAVLNIHDYHNKYNRLEWDCHHFHQSALIELFASHHPPQRFLSTCISLYPLVDALCFEKCGEVS